jgi:hypothetical protein
MAGHTLAIGERSNRGRCQEDVKLAVRQSKRYRVEVPIGDDMIINVETGHQPLTDDERFRRKWLQGSSFDGFEQRPARALAWRAEWGSVSVRANR